jgi:hypothetical protein
MRGVLISRALNLGTQAIDGVAKPIDCHLYAGVSTDHGDETASSVMLFGSLGIIQGKIGIGEAGERCMKQSLLRVCHWQVPLELQMGLRLGGTGVGALETPSINGRTTDSLKGS